MDQLSVSGKIAGRRSRRSAEAQEPGAPATAHLGGSPLFAARTGWMVIAASTVALFLGGIPQLFTKLQILCGGDGCNGPQLSTESAQALTRLGLSLRFYAVSYIALESVFVLGFCAVAAVIFRHRSDEPFALFAATTLVLLGGITFSESVTALGERSLLWRLPITFLSFLGSASSLILFYLFPDGRFVPRWTRLAAVAWTCVCALGFYSPADFPLNQDPQNPGHLFPAVAFGFMASGIGAQVYRYRHLADPVQRQQAKWVACGFVAALGGLFLGVFVIEPRIIHSAHPAAMVLRIVGLTDFALSLLLIPLSIGIAVLKYRLWDIDVIINRTLVYGALTACVVGMYSLVVAGLGALVHARESFVLSLLAAGLVAILFQPLRIRLQRAVNRLMYGERDDPYAVLSRLGQRLEATLAPDAVLLAIVGTIAEALRLPYAAIAVRDEDALTIAAERGSPRGASLRLPLTYQHELVGELVLSARTLGETFGVADRRLLDDLARQAGVAVHAVRLTTALQRARERLVVTREEERRRLRRDVHDGLGPALSAQILKLGAARHILRDDPAAADAMLVGLEDDLEKALADIRRLVYNLRPPALDELGLVGAIRERVAHQYGALEAGDRLVVTVDAPERAPPIPAAVEVAAYRIIQEALTNVVRHAQARVCTIRLRFDDAVDITIADDGIGFQREHPAGVGLASMRERATELGGILSIEARPACGTRVLAHVPIPRTVNRESITTMGEGDGTAAHPDR